MSPTDDKGYGLRSASPRGTRQSGTRTWQSGSRLRKPPLLTEGGLSNSVFIVTRYTEKPHPTIPGETMIVADEKFDVTAQFDALAEKRAERSA